MGRSGGWFGARLRHLCVWQTDYKGVTTRLTKTLGIAPHGKHGSHGFHRTIRTVVWWRRKMTIRRSLGVWHTFGVIGVSRRRFF